MPLHENTKEHLIEVLRASPYLFAYHESLNYVIIFLDHSNTNLLLCRIPDELTYDRSNYYFVAIPYDEKPPIRIHEQTEEEVFDEFNKRYLLSSSIFIVKIDTLHPNESFIHEYGLGDENTFISDGAIEYVFGA